MILPKRISIRSLALMAGVDYQRLLRANEGASFLTKEESKKIYDSIQKTIEELQQIKEFDFVK